MKALKWTKIFLFGLTVSALLPVNNGLNYAGENTRCNFDFMSRCSGDFVKVRANRFQFDLYLVVIFNRKDHRSS